MALTVSNYLGQLQDEPDNETALEGLREALKSGEPSRMGEHPTRLVEAARQKHLAQGELRAAAALLDIEAGLASSDPDRAAALYKELARLRFEELLDDAGAKIAIFKALELRPGDDAAQELVEQIDQAAASWKDIAKRFVEEAQSATDATLRASLLTRAAVLMWQYRKKGREKETDKLFGMALAADPAATRTARLFAETLRQRESWDELGVVLSDAAGNARQRDEKLNFSVAAARVFARRTKEKAKAAELYANVLDLVPGREEALSFLVAYYTESEEWDHLVALYEDALRSRQKLESEVGILLQIGMVHWRIRSAPQQAEPYFQRLRKINPAFPAMLDFYRDYYKGAKDQSPLLTILGDAQRVATERDVKLSLAIELARGAQQSDATLERAIDAWKAVQRLEPQSPEAHAALKDLYRRAEKWNALVEVLKAEIDVLPADATDRRVALLREMVPVYRDELSLDVMVINTYNAILQADPNDQEALDALAKTYESIGRWNDLIQVLTRKADASSRKDEKVAYYMRVAGLWIDRFANYNQATRPLEQVIAVDPENREALARLKDIYGKKRAWKPLFDVMLREAEVVSDPDARLDMWIELAKLAADRLHKNSDAIGLYRRVVEQNPRKEGALDALEKLAKRERDYATMAEALERRVELETDEKNKLKFLTELGAVYGEHLADPVAAAGAWKRVLAIEPRNGRALRTLREAYLAASDWEALEALYSEASDWEGLVEVLGAAAEKAEETELKIRLSFRAAEIYEAKIGEAHRAFRNYERVLAVDPKNARAARALVPIYQKDERWNRLAATYEIVLETLPRNAPDSDRLDLLDKLRRLAVDSLRDSPAAFEYAARAYALAPSDPAVVQGLEAAADAAGFHERLVEIYRARLASADDKEAQRLRRRIAAIAGERLGKPDEAIAQLKQILEANPNDPDAIAVLDRLYRSEGKTEDLRALLQHRLNLAQEPTDRWMLFDELARLEEDVIGDPDSAIERYQGILEIEPEDKDALAALDRLFNMRERYADLAKIVRRRRETAEDDAQRLEHTVRLGQLLANKLNDPREALHVYSEALEIAAGNEAAVTGLEALEKNSPELAGEVGRLLERAYESRKSHEKLAVVLRRRLEGTKDEAERRELRLRLAELLGTQLGDVEAAYASLETAFLDQPGDHELSQRLSQAAERAGKHEALASAYATAIEAGDLDALTVATLSQRVAELYDVVLGRPAEAEPFHKRVLAHDSLDDRAFVALKELYTNSERWDELQALYRARIEQTFDGTAKLELLLQLCMIFEDLLEDPNLAIQAYREVLELDVAHVASRRALERLYRKTERFRDLAALLHEELDGAEGQDAIDLTFELATLYESRLADPRLAVDHYERVLQDQPTHLRTQEALERLIVDAGQRQRIAAILEPLYDAQGAYPQLVKVLEVQLEAAADSDARLTTLLRLAELYEQKLRDPGAAFHALSRAVEASPSDVRAREELARVATIRGTERERAAVLEKAIEASKDNVALSAELLFELARLWDEQVNDASAAERAFERLIMVDPESADVVIPAARALERIHLERGEHGKLGVDLRRQIQFENDTIVRGVLLVRLADLLEETLQDVKGAIAAHRERLETEPGNQDALRALERLYEREHDWPALIEVLRQREAATFEEPEQQAICVRIGDIYEQKLGDRDNAIVAYNDALTRFGPDRGVLRSLQRLYEAQESWEELLEVVEKDYEQAQDGTERSELRFRAAELMRLRTSELERSIEAYSEVLEQQPTHPGAIASLESIMASGEREPRLAASRVLVNRYEATNQYESLIRALSALAQGDSAGERMVAYKRAAEVADIGVGDPSRAFDLLSQAVRFGLGESELDGMLRDLERLAGAAGRYADYVKMLREIGPDILDGDLQVEVLLKVANNARTRLDDAALASEYYGKVLEQRTDHAGALDALEELNENAGNHRGLLDIVRRKAELAIDRPEERVRLLLRQADIAENRLDDTQGAIEAYEAVLAESERGEAYAGLERLYRKTQRYSDLAALYERQLDKGAFDPVDVRFKLGNVQREHQNDPGAALDLFREALAQNPNHQPTIDVLEGLMQDPTHRAKAAELLEPVFLARMDWPKVTAALEARVALMEDVEGKKTLLRRLGKIHEEHHEDLDGALEVYARLFREDPADEDVWDTLSRLARILEAYGRLADIYAGKLKDIEVDDASSAKLALLTGKLFDEKVKDLDRAAKHLRRALDYDTTSKDVFDVLESVQMRRADQTALLELYRERVDIAASDAERLSLLHKSARIYRTALGDTDKAIDTYREALEVDAADKEATEALDQLFTATERWTDLADHLRHRIELAGDTRAGLDLKHRLGAVLADRLKDRVAAIDTLEEVVTTMPEHAASVAALEQMVMEEDESRLRITQILEPIYRGADQWKKLVAISEAQISLIDEPSEKVRLLGEVARLHEERGRNGELAFDAWSRAFAITPADDEIRAEVDRIATAYSAWDAQVASYERAIAAENDAIVKAQLLAVVAQVHDTKRGDPRSAIETYERVLELGGDDPAPLEALEGLHTMVGDWRGMVDVVKRKVERTMDPVERGELLRRAGSVMEELLHDREGAIDAYRRAVSEDESDEIALEALDGLYVATGDHGALADVLERRVTLSQDAETRIELGLRLGALSDEALKRPTEAVTAYQRVLEDDSKNKPALAALVKLYARQNMWPELLETLGVQAEMASGADRVLLVHRQGEVLEKELDDANEALERYRAAIELDPKHEPSIQALLRLGTIEDYRLRTAEVLVPLFEAAERHGDLVSVLEGRAQSAADPLEKRDLLRRLAQVQEQGLGNRDAAFDALVRALAEDATDLETANEIERIAEQQNSYERAANAFAQRASSIDDPTAARALYTRLARVAEEKLGDDARAIEAYVRATEQVGDEDELLSALDRLYAKSQSFPELVDILERRIQLLEPGLERNELLLRAGSIKAEHRHDARGALTAYQEVAELNPSEQRAVSALEKMLDQEDLVRDVIEVLDGVYRQTGATAKVADLFEARIRIADSNADRVRYLQEVASVREHELGNPVAALDTVRRAFELDPRDEMLVADLERLATMTGAWDRLRGLVEAVTEANMLEPHEKRSLHQRAARWYEEHMGDLEAAKARLEVAIAADPRAPECHAELVRLLRRGDDHRALVDALQAYAPVAESESEQKDLLREAAKLAEERLGDTATAATCYAAILEIDSVDPQALDELARIRTTEGKFAEVVGLLERRIDGEADPATRLQLRHRIADVYTGPLDDQDRAADAYSAVLDEDPTDLKAIGALETIYEKTERWEDLSSLLERRLDIATSNQERVAARVRLARLSERRFGRREEAMEQLREILELDPDNREALDELARLLTLDKKWEDLVDLLERRIGDAGSRGDRGLEVTLLEKLAGVLGTSIGDPERAADTYERILQSEPGRVTALQALFAIHEQGDAHRALDVLERLLAVQSGEGAAVTALKMADLAETKLNDEERALAALRAAHTADPRSVEARTRLKAHYEKHSQWEPLLEMLAAEAEATTSPPEKIAAYKRLATLYATKLNAKDRAATYLEQAAKLAPEDREVLLPLCDMYIESGRSKDAIPVLEQIIASFGNRRVKEVAQFQHRLGRALEESGNIAGALERYDAAFKIDLTNVHILRDLGKLYHRQGELDRAQKTFRALLLQKLDEDAGITKADVYFYLGDIIAQQGDKPKAISMLERAVHERADHGKAKQLLQQLRGS